MTSRRSSGARRGLRAGIVASALLAASSVSPCVAASYGGAYGRLLAEHVRAGTIAGIRLNLVDYAALGKDPDYAAALRELAAARPEDLATEDERFAFWANAYNLLAIKTIVDRYPIASIRDGGNFLFPVWKKTAGTVAGRDFSLDEIEHDVLRAKFREPRVHFAIVCASVSCPDLRTEPYTGTRLDEQLAEQTRLFLDNRGKGLASGPEGKSARVSMIFSWFADDFVPAGGVAAFLRNNASPETAKQIAGLEDDAIGYLDYDWSLNDTSRDGASSPSRRGRARSRRRALRGTRVARGGARPRPPSPSCGTRSGRASALRDRSRRSSRGCAPSRPTAGGPVREPGSDRALTNRTPSR